VRWLVTTGALIFINPFLRNQTSKGGKQREEDGSMTKSTRRKQRSSGATISTRPAAAGRFMRDRNEKSDGKIYVG